MERYNELELVDLYDSTKILVVSLYKLMNEAIEEGDFGRAEIMRSLAQSNEQKLAGMKVIADMKGWRV